MKAAIYTRISLDKTGESLGVARQLDDCMALADKLGWEVVEHFDDNDLSAYSRSTARPRYEAMLDAMKRGEVGGLICWHTDRLYRRMGDLETLIEIADAARVKIKTVQGGDLDLSTSAGRMVARILGSVSNQESEHKGERQRAANVQKAALGRWQTVHRPFGYTMTGEPLEPEATIVRKAVSDVLGGKSIRRLAIEWNEAGIKTTLGKTWNSPRIRRLLVNPRYAALKVHQRKIVGPGEWEALIDADTYHGLVAYLSDPSRKPGSTFERKYQGSGVYRCGECGGPMRAAFPGGRSRGRFYACRGANHVVRKGEPLDDFVTDLVVGRLERLTRDGGPRLVFDGEDDPIDITAVRAQRAALQARLDELAAMFTEGIIDGSQLRSGTAQFRSQATLLDAQLATAVRTDPVAEITKDGPDGVAKNWVKATPDKRGKVIEKLMTVTVNKAPRGGKGFNHELIGIDWKGRSSPAVAG